MRHGWIVHEPLPCSGRTSTCSCRLPAPEIDPGIAAENCAYTLTRALVCWTGAGDPAATPPRVDEEVLVGLRLRLTRRDHARPVRISLHLRAAQARRLPFGLWVRGSDGLRDAREPDDEAGAAWLARLVPDVPVEGFD